MPVNATLPGRPFIPRWPCPLWGTRGHSGLEFGKGGLELTMSTLHVSSAWLAMTGLTAAIVIGLPFIFGTIARKKLGVGWKYFWLGALVFLVFQLLTRVPIIIALQATALAPRLSTSIAFTWIWLVILALTAGLFEEVGRYVGYRVFMRREPKTWAKGVMFGLGHAGLESAVLIGGQLILTILSLVLISAIPVDSLPAAQRQTVLQQVASIKAQPIWLPWLSAWERLWSFPLQVALSVLVLQVFRRRQMRWLYLAILFHALIDFVTAALSQAFGHSIGISLLVEGIICIFGLFGVWIIWRLREPGEPPRCGLLTKPQEKRYDDNSIS